MEDILAIIFIFGGGTLVVMSFSPLGRAIADRLRGRSAAPPETLEDVETLKEQMAVLSQQVSELAERQDFAERMLAQAREKGLLGSGGQGT